jgi:hypothetical protein
MLRYQLRLDNENYPKARHTIVTNLFNLPKWLVAMSLNEFSGQIETCQICYGPVLWSISPHV